MIETKNIVITDFNAVASCGIGKGDFANGILSNKDCCRDITTFDTTEFDVKKGFDLDIDFQTILGKGGLRHINRNSKIAMSSIEGLLPHFTNLDEGEKPTIIMGTAFGSADSIAEFWKVALTEGFAGLRPLEFPNTTINSSGSFLNIRYGITNGSITICNGYNSSHDAFIYASDYIQNGYSPWALVGGSEELGKFIFLGQLKSGVLTKDSSYDITKNSGYSAGEGAAFFLVEEENYALSNSRTPIAQLVGYSSRYGKDLEVATSCYKEALKIAKSGVDDIRLISSGMNGYKNEIYDDVYSRLFDSKKSSKMEVISYKRYFGECYGASGSLQLASALTNNSLKGGDLFVVDNFCSDGNNSVLIFRKL